MITIEQNNIDTMPTEELNYGVALDIVDRFTTMNELSMYSTICMMIDTLSAKYGEASVSIASRVLDAVKDVNEACGAYCPF